MTAFFLGTSNMHRKGLWKMRKFIPEISLMITAIIWGSGFVASAMALDHYTPYQIMFIRFFTGAVLLVLLFYKRLKHVNKAIIWRGVVLGAILYLAFVLQTAGLQFTTPSKNAFLTAVNVVIVPFIGLALYKHKLDKFELLGAILAITGVGVMSLKLSATINIGDLLSLLCAVAFAFQIFYTARFVRDSDPIVLTLVQMVSASFFAGIIVLWQGEMAFSLESQALGPVLYLGVFSTTLAYLLQTMAQKFISETKTAIILSTESLWGMIFSVIILSELITGRMMLGAILILVAIIISETKLKWKRKEPIIDPIKEKQIS